MGKLFKVPGGEYLVDSEDYEIRKDEFGRPILCPLNQGGGGDQPKLYAPEIKITGDTLTIIPNTDNGAFVTGYNGYMSVDGGDFELYGTLPSDQLELDLTAVGLPEGNFQFKATAIGTNFQDSDASNIANYTNIGYTVTNTLTNCTSNNSTTSLRKGSSYTATLTASAGYTMSGATASIIMSGVDITADSFDDANGIVNIASVSGDISITISAAEFGVAELTWNSAQGISSSDGINLISHNYDNAMYCFKGSEGEKIYKTTDGKTWTNTGITVPNVSTTSASQLVVANNKMFAFDSHMKLKEFSDVSNPSSGQWSSSPTTITSSIVRSIGLSNVFLVNDRVVAVGEGYVDSKPRCVICTRTVDNDTWSQHLSNKDISTSYFYAREMNNKIFVFFTNKNYVYTSDFSTYSEGVLPYVTTGACVYNNGMYVVKGSGTLVMTSADGITWESYGSEDDTKNSMPYMVYSDVNGYYARGDSTIARSNNGTQWAAADATTKVWRLEQIGNVFVRIEHDNLSNYKVKYAM